MSDIPSVGIRLLTGADNVDFWSEQEIWDKALREIQVVVSTPAVLADALGHGFVNISRLGLIVFDEGILDHPGPLPSYLGLSGEFISTYFFFFFFFLVSRIN